MLVSLGLFTPTEQTSTQFRLHERARSRLMGGGRAEDARSQNRQLNDPPKAQQLPRVCHCGHRTSRQACFALLPASVAWIPTLAHRPATPQGLPPNSTSVPMSMCLSLLSVHWSSWVPIPVSRRENLVVPGAWVRSPHSSPHHLWPGSGRSLVQQHLEE